MHYCPEKGRRYLDDCQIQWLQEGFCPLYQAGAFNAMDDKLLFGQSALLVPVCTSSFSLSFTGCSSRSPLLAPSQLLTQLILACPRSLSWEPLFTNHCLLVTSSSPGFLSSLCQWPPTSSPVLTPLQDPGPWGSPHSWPLPVLRDSQTWVAQPSRLPLP